MELTVVWTKYAQNKLQEIYEYYKFKASINIASKLVNSIVDKTIDLELNPKIGQIEEALNNRKKEFRYLVFKKKNYLFYKLSYK